MAFTIEKYTYQGGTSDSQFHWRIAAALISMGAEVYGSSDGSALADNSGAGAVNYWDGRTLGNGAWCRLRWPTVDGATRELLLDRNAAGRLWVSWSAGPTYFETGGLPTAKPTTSTVGDTITVLASTIDFIDDSASAVGWHLVIVKGDASEGRSFYVSARSATTLHWTSAFGIDVLSWQADPADTDTAVYFGQVGGAWGVANSSSFLFGGVAPPASSQCAGGWYRHDTPASRAQVGFYLGSPYMGYMSGSIGSITNVFNDPRGPDNPAEGRYFALPAYWTRARSKAGLSSTTVQAYKGKSRLFAISSSMFYTGGAISSTPGVRQTPDKGWLVVGVLCSRWDGETPY